MGMTKVYTDADLDRAQKASEDAFLMDEPTRNDVTEKLASIWTYREVWGAKAAVWFAQQSGISYQPAAE